jgi:hypothetical protein
MVAISTATGSCGGGGVTRGGLVSICHAKRSHSILRNFLQASLATQVTCSYSGRAKYVIGRNRNPCTYTARWFRGWMSSTTGLERYSNSGCIFTVSEPCKWKLNGTDPDFIDGGVMIISLETSLKHSRKCCELYCFNSHVTETDF